MLGLVTVDECWDVINFSKDHANDHFLQGQTRRFFETYRKRPGFFKPYEGRAQLIGGLLAPLVYPLVLSFFSGLTLLCAAVGGTLSLGCLFIAAGTALLGNSELCDDSIETASTLFYITGLALVAAAVSVFLAVASTLHSLCSVVTRLVASASCSVKKIDQVVVEPEDKPWIEMETFSF